MPIEMAITTPASPPAEDSRLSASEPAVRTTPKNLVVCIDGTSNQFGRSNTNVVKLFDAIDLNTNKRKQLTYYSSGIGTRTGPQALVDRVKDKLDMAVAWSVDKNIKEAYGWLAEKYERGDDIFLFGFSRGAYQVRALAGMIHEVGLIRTRTERQIARAYDCYEAIRPGKPEARHIARKFKKTFCWDGVKIHFIGVWDTVSSVGLIRGDVSLPMSSPAGHVRHALALDERRVKFMPEYFRETSFNSAENALDIERVDTSGGDESADIKEVWFAGSHGDVGGMDRPGRINQAGNVSLLWMYREAAKHGLQLRPTEFTWGPDDIDFGTWNSMSTAWRFIESLPIKHQVSYGGLGGDARRIHGFEARLIMPHQKVHASILYANAYRPRATRGRGFDISMMYETPEDMELEPSFWETNLFGDVEAEELVNSLSRRRLGATECLEKLLFMLRFEEGKRCVRNVPGWQEKFKKIIDDSSSAPHIKLVAIVAYYEASCDFREYSQDLVHHCLQMPSATAFKDAKQCLGSILQEQRHRYNSRAVALLNALTRHKHLREHILTDDVLKTFVKLVDSAIAAATRQKVPKFGQRDNNFVLVMKGLNSLLQFRTTRKFIIPKLAEKYPKSEVSRLSRILEVNHLPFLIAALRMVLTLTKIPNFADKLQAGVGTKMTTAKVVFSFVEPRIRELAMKRGGIIGPLAVEIWFAFYDPKEKRRLSLPGARFSENLASALVRTNFNLCNSADEKGIDNVLTCIFGLDANELDGEQKKLVRGLKKSAQKGDPRVRTTMTMTLLKLCRNPVVRAYLCEINLVEMFVDQLQYQGSALLAAYALATCLKDHPDMMEIIEGNALLPKYIVRMLRLDYFDGAIGQVEGLTIFVQLMQHSTIRNGIMEHNMMGVLGILGGKAGKDQLRNILSGLLYKDRDTKIPTSPVESSNTSTKTCTQLLIDMSLDLLRDPKWKSQKIGVTILTALAQTPDGVEIVGRHIAKIIKMILPEKYGEGSNETAPFATTAKNTPRLASRLMGPACALRNLALNKSLQQSIRNMKEYCDLREIFFSQTLVSERETAPWLVHTPTKSDVASMLEKMIKAAEGELSEEDLLWIGDTLPPNIQHWKRALMFLGYTATGVALMPAALGAAVGFSALTVVALAVGVPLYYLSDQTSEHVSSVLRRRKGPTPQGTRGAEDTQEFVTNLVWVEGEAQEESV